MKRYFLVALAILALTSSASARPHHRHHKHHRGHHHGAVQVGRPAACAGIPWCGCWLRLQLGINDARLNLARAWASVGINAGGPAPGAIAVWRHHVGKITAVLGPGRIRLISGNDGHAVRDRERSTRGIIAYRYVVGAGV